MPERTPDESSAICPRCGVGCRLRSGADASRAEGVPGAANPDGRLCRDGIGSFDARDDRLTEPRVRRDGELEPVSWDAAYERIADLFGAILDERGPDALAFLGAPHCTNEENYLLQKLARVLGTNNVDNRARLCHASMARTLDAQVGWPATTNGLADVAEADVILVAGANPAERQPIAFNSFVRPAVNEGTSLVHVDPVGNRTTRVADVHLTPRPGTDALVFDLLSAELLEGGAGVDRSFVEDRTRGFDRFEASIADGKREERLVAAGVDDDAIRRVATRLAAADRVAAIVGTGMENSLGETNASEALLNLLLLTGNLGRRGTGIHVFRGLANEQGATDAGCVPDRLPGHQPVTDAAARARAESEWGAEPPSSPGRTAEELLASFGDEVRGVLAVGENPAVSKRDREWVRRRLAALDALVVVDLEATETARHADVVLPAAEGVEKAGTFTNLERRLQRTRPARTPPGNARPDFRILSDLGERLTGRPDAFEYAGVSDAFEELTRVAPTHAGLSYDELGGEGRQWPAESDSVLYREAFETADGRAAFGSAQPLVRPPTEDGLWLVTGGRAQNTSHPVDDRSLRINPVDAERRGIEPADTVLVEGADASVRTTAELDDGVRRGTVYVPAAAADPLLRADATVVSVRPRSSEKGSR